MSLSDSLGDSPVSESDSNTGFSGRNQRSDVRGSVASAIFQAPLRARRKKTALTQAVPGQVPTPTPLRRAWCDMMRLLAAPKNWSTADVQIKPIRSTSTSQSIYTTQSPVRGGALSLFPPLLNMFPRRRPFPPPFLPVAEECRYTVFTFFDVVVNAEQRCILIAINPAQSIMRVVHRLQHHKRIWRIAYTNRQCHQSMLKFPPGLSARSTHRLRNDIVLGDAETILERTGSARNPS